MANPPCYMPNQITQCYHLNTDIEFNVFRIQKGVLCLCMADVEVICIVIGLWVGECHDSL